MTDGFGLSPQQRRLWRLQSTLGERPFRARALARLRGGGLDSGLLREAVDQVVGRYEILRTTFPCLPGLTLPVQRVMEGSAATWHEMRDLSGLADAEREAALEDLLRSLEAEPFDLVRGPLLRLGPARLSDREHALILVLPSLCADAVTLRNLVREIASSYASLAGAAPAEEGSDPLQYADLAEWQNELLDHEETAAGREHWEAWDPAACFALRLPFESPPADGGRFEPVSLAIPLDHGLAQHTAALAATMGTSAATLCLAAWQSLLWRLTGQPEIVLGLAAECRSYEGLSESLGPLASVVPLPARLGGDLRFVDAMSLARDAVREAVEWQEYFRWESVADRCGLSLEEASFPVSFVVQDHPEPWRAGLLEWELPRCEAGIGRYRLELRVRTNGGPPAVDLAWDAAAVSREDAEGLARAWRALLSAAVIRPESRLGELALAAPEERRHLALAGIGEEPVAPVMVHELFEREARRVPGRTAVLCGGGSFSYAELEERSRRLARFLRRHGVGPDALVAVCLERSLAMPLAVMGVLRAGGAYLPLEPELPLERKSFLFADARPRAILTATRFLTALPAVQAPVLCLDGPWEEELQEAGGEPDPPGADPMSLAYVIYTSGSTGVPKGVAVEHRQLSNYVQGTLERLGLDDGAGYAMVSTIAADLGHTALFPSLCSGSTLHLIADELTSDPIGLAAALERDPVDCLKITPSHLAALLAGDPSPWLLPRACLVLGGEASRCEWVEGLITLRPGLRVINEYGPTETTVGTLTCVAEPGIRTATLPLGQSLAGTTTWLLGPDLEPLPAWFSGELYLGGASVARGYLGRPDLTADRFIPDPLADMPGARMYRTGDLARRLSDGTLEFLGRADDQVKVRGFRIEPGEIETVLEGHPEVRRAAVVARDDGSGSHRLVAYVVAESGSAVGAPGLREHLMQRLPDFMVPSAFVYLDALPLNTNGKVDRRALPEPDWRRLGESRAFVAPETPSERILADIWAEVLGVDRVGALDNFFLLGGDSIRSLVVRARAVVRGITFSVQQLFQNPTIRSLAQECEIAGAASSDAQPTRAFELIPEEERRRLSPGIEDAYPLARLQTGMLFHSEHSPESAIYHDQHSAFLQGTYDHALLQKAVNQVVDLHPVLRTSFDLADFDEPLQLVHREVEIPVTEEDLRHLEPEAQREAIEDWLQQERQRGFDWRRPPLIRFHVHRRGEGSFQFSFSFHHAVLDGWSAASLSTQLFARYLSLLEDPESPPDSAPGSAFRDFVALERRTLTDPESREIWRRQIAGAATIRLPRWPLAKPSPRGRTLRVPFSAELTADLRRLAHSCELPLKSFLVAAHLRVLSLICGQSEVTTGLISNGRPETTDGEKTLGLFLNALPFRLRVDAESWCELARSAFDLERMLLPHRRFPLAELQAMKGAPLFEISFNFIHFHVYQSISEMRGLGVAEIMGYEETSFPLGVTFHLDPSGTRVQTILNFSESALDPSQVTAIAGYYARALPAMVASPRARPLATPILANEELHQLLHDWQGRRTADPAPCVHESFALQARRVPGRTAVSCRDRSLTYRELDEKADRLARHLRLRGVRPGSVVAICLERSLEAVIALLGILKAGGAYLPLDPELSRDRKALLLGEAHPVAVVTARRFCASLPAERVATLVVEDEDEVAETPDATAVCPVDPRDLAYILFTSGSTGVPKGVAVEHRQLARYVASILERLDLPDGAIFAMISTFAADLGNTMLFPSLCSGRHLRLVPSEMATDPVALAEDFRRQPVDALKITPGHLDALLSAAGGEVLPRRRLVFGGEALRWDLLRRVRAAVPELEILNHYGPTETTVGVLTQPIPQSKENPISATVPLGTPLPGCAVHVLGPSLDPLPVFVPGELQIGGETVTRGYLGRPDLTADRFVPDPFAEVPGARMYRTGDLGRRLPGGAVEFLGRTDHQVKIRGFRVEPAEIETALAAHPSVREAVVLAREDAASHLCLVAYLVTADGEPPPIHALRADLEKRLPRHMIPAAFVHLPAFPLNANGKIDRARLPAPAAGDPSRETAYVAPRGQVEEMLAAIWAEVLGVERVGAEDNFFELGGHSLIAIRAIARLRNTFEIDLPLRMLFDAPTVEGLAARIAEAARSGARLEIPPIERAPRDPAPPLSFAQQRLWFLDLLDPGSPVYNIPAAILVTGALDRAALAAGFERVVARHEALRTTFELAGDEPVQRISPPGPVPLPLVDLSALPQACRDAEAGFLAREEALRPFDLRHGPLLRLALLRLAEEEHVLLRNVHHIVSDEWSTALFIREVAAFYAACRESRLAPPPLPPLPVQYADYASWQRRWMSSEALDGLLRYWRERLAGAPQVLELPSDRPRPAIPSGRGGSAALPVPAAQAAAIASLARREDATLFMALLAVFGTLLLRYTGREDLVVGSDVANRDRVETEELIGFFVNQLVLRLDTGGDPSFLGLLEQVREVALGAYAHQDLPFEKLVDALQPQRDLTRHPVFQVAFVLQNASAAEAELPGLSLRRLKTGGGVARFDLTVAATATAGGGLRLGTEHSSDLFDDTTAARLLGHFAALLEAAAAAPQLPLSALPLLPEAERQQVLIEWNDSAAVRPEEGPTFDALFAARAAARPDAVAAVCGSEQLTYRELDRRVDRLARSLAARGIGCGSVVALLAERSLRFLTAVLAVFRAGGAYLPLDPLHPAQRSVRLALDSGTPLVLTERRFAGALAHALDGATGGAPPAVSLLEDRLEEPESRAALPPPAAPGDLAYVLYTSGSTGVPKGAMIEHRGMLNHLWAKVAALGLGEGDAVAQTASQCFDISVWQLLAALLAGGRVEVVPDDVTHDPQLLLAEIERRGITVLETVPSLLRLLIEELETRGAARPLLAPLRWMIPTGEALPPALCRHWLLLHPDIPLLNAYGPTECSDDVTHWAVRTAPHDPRAQIPIGRPVSNLRLYALGREIQALPAGVPGELYVGGAGVGRGYLGDAGRTAAAWVPDPFSESPGARLYRTGDLARCLPDGRIEFLGRADHQVKVRGHRIELGEIESVLAAHPAVQQAAVLAREDTPGDRRLVAYVVARPGAEPATAELRRALAERLPDAMIPSAFLVLPAFPLTPNGKLDRQALPVSDTRPALDQGYSAPATAVEETLARIWAQVLRLDRVGVHDNFFHLGGDSILCIQVVSRANQEGLRLTPRQIFQHQTIAELAAVAGVAETAAAEQSAVTGELPLTPIQHWFFAQRFADPGHWNQSLLLASREPLDPAHLERALALLLAHHDALRLRFPGTAAGRPRQVLPAPGGEVPLTVLDLSALPEARRADAIAAAAGQLHTGLDLERGPIVRAALHDLGPGSPGRLHLVIHHLAIDGVSWQILLADLQAAYRAIARREEPVLPAKTLSYKSWAERLAAQAHTARLAAEREIWLSVGRAPAGRLPVDRAAGANTVGSAGIVVVELPAEETAALLQEIPPVYRTQINDALLTALARALARWTGERRVLVELEGHGREELFEGADVSRTVGWFTSEFPLLLELTATGDPGADLKAVKERLRALPRGGTGYGLLRYLGDEETAVRLAALPDPEILFNYHGQIDTLFPADSSFRTAPEPGGSPHGPRNHRTHLLEVNGWIAGGCLRLSWAYSRNVHRRSTIEDLAGRYLGELRELIDHCRAPQAGGYTPSDFAAARLNQDELDRFLSSLEQDVAGRP